MMEATPERIGELRLIALELGLSADDAECVAQIVADSWRATPIDPSEVTEG